MTRQTIAGVLCVVCLIAADTRSPSVDAAEPTDTDSSPPEAHQTLGFDAAVSLCRDYLDSDDDDERRERLAARLSRYSGEIDPVLRALAARKYPAWKPGYHAELKFDSAELREKYPRDLLYFHVPKSYSPEQASGLIVFLHGGGLNTSRDAPAYTFEDDESAELFEQTGMVVVGPSAPGKGESYYRWCLRDSEQYLVDVIADCKRRFHIDPDRVVLLGHSMGGFGAFHHAQRQPDRFAAIIASSGAWDWGYWPALRGTPFMFVHGVNDAVKGDRWHHTDVEYGRKTHAIFEKAGLDHKYYEHDGQHSFTRNHEGIADFFRTRKPFRRDPNYPHIAVATPQGWTHNYMNPVRHNRWLTLDETTAGEIEVDEFITHGSRDDFDRWSIEPQRTKRRGASAEAINHGGNRIDVTTKNVAGLTVWLHPQMVDATKPVTITVNKSLRVTTVLRPSLVTALESYERRHDWGLIYPMKVSVRVPAR